MIQSRGGGFGFVVRGVFNSGCYSLLHIHILRFAGYRCVVVWAYLESLILMNYDAIFDDL